MSEDPQIDDFKDAKGAGQITKIKNDPLIVSRYFWSQIRIGFIFVFAGLAVSYVSILISDWRGDDEYYFMWGLSVYGAFHILRFISWKRELTQANNETPNPIPVISPLKGTIEIIILFVVIIGAWLYASSEWFVEDFSEDYEQYASTTPKAYSEPSTLIPGWFTVGKESEVMTFALPSQADFVWAEGRSDTLPIPTKVLNYSAVSDDNDGYYVTIEWLYDDSGKRLYTPTTEVELRVAKDWFGDEEAVVEHSEYKKDGIEGTHYSVVSGDQKISGIFFERDGVFYNLYVWPNNMIDAETRLTQLLSTVVFKSLDSSSTAPAINE